MDSSEPAPVSFLDSLRLPVVRLEPHHLLVESVRRRHDRTNYQSLTSGRLSRRVHIRLLVDTPEGNSLGLVWNRAGREGLCPSLNSSYPPLNLRLDSRLGEGDALELGCTSFLEGNGACAGALLSLLRLSRVIGLDTMSALRRNDIVCRYQLNLVAGVGEAHSRYIPVITTSCSS